ncbi:neoverrucotoxin subunit alpha-like [Xiphophorus couchianus]|uniref:neoverrucotoxin subunit alpha-like n=1 Tax=Xiphophorus couchianus TaxID=32473 RepID=UPI001015D6AA|nr:neoverrucotoxin subunit alpha-like [Xiphophorus couchianus]XP_027880410.1 neoverrucotoxin subunit alpha-like [Xiphophorus couchianus]
MDIDGVVEVAALGRPFGLGMLYDLRSDSLVTGMTLWDEDTLSKHIQVRDQNFNEFEVITSDSLQSKTSSLNVNASSLKLSIFSGNVSVGGSGNYLNESKSSKHQARVTLRYKETNQFKEMSMHHLGKLKYGNVIDKGLATHVVTGILYGAQAFFVFDREVSEDENHQAIHGDLKIMIKKIPKFAGQVRGDVKMDNEDRKKVDQFSCTFFGDVCLEKTPTTFEEAVETYKSLPALFKKAVPMTVFMLPLTSLQSSASKLVTQISAGLVQEVQSVLEDFTELEMRCNDTLKTATLQPFSQLGEKLNRFKGLCAELKLEFQQTLAEKLPLIRGGVVEEAELTKVLEETHSSLCNSKTLNQWIDQKEKEIYTLMLFKEKMKNTIFIQSETQLYKEVMSKDQAQILCFVFTSLGRDEPFLSALSAYLKGTRQDNKGAGFEEKKERKHPSASEIVAQETIEKVKLFIDFAEGNKENQKTKFLAVGLTDDNHKGSTIYLYENGFLVNTNYELPSKPETVTADDINHNSVTLKVSPPRFGAESVISYSVEVRENTADKWNEKIEPNAEKVTVRDLKPNTEYVFRCRGVTSVGYGPASDPSNPIKTLPCSPPEELHAHCTTNNATVSLKKPAEIGQDVQISNYVLNCTGNNEENHQMTVDDKEQAIFSDLEPNVRYNLNVYCKCGDAGTSKEATTSLKTLN